VAQIRVDPKKLRDYCSRTAEMYRRILDHDWLRQRSVLLSYEQLVSAPDYWIREAICPLLEVTAAPLTTSLRKQNTLSRAERVVDYEQVANLFDSSFCHQWLAWPQ
jgi:hypothetical protein